MPEVIKIPATKTEYTAEPIESNKKKRVAAYARVSTELEEQQSSYETQVAYYTDYIINHPDWEFVKVYADEGKSGVGTKNRKGFNEMVSDALSGKIDLIITKSVSRFARNTVDSLTTIRNLKSKGVECYFEKENIRTFDSKGELLITIMSSLAQEESRSLSENTTWGKRKRFANGKPYVPFSRFLGYDRGPDGALVVNRKEAVTVRRIYDMFLRGMSTYGIAKQLTAEGIPAPGGGKKWYENTVKSILQNEKYKGDALLQKTFTVDYLTKKIKKNEGEVPQYYVKNSHEAIVSSDTFDMVQREMARRNKTQHPHSGTRLFSSRIICGQCGGRYGPKVWHSTNKYRKLVWQCNRKYDNRCTTPHFSEDELKSIFVSAVNKLLASKDSIIEEFEGICAEAADTSAPEAKLAATEKKLDNISELMKKCIRESGSRAEYQKRYDNLSAEFDKTEAEVEKIKSQIEDKNSRKTAITVFLKELRALNGPVTAFDENMFTALTDCFTVYSKDDVRVTFKNGLEISP